MGEDFLSDGFTVTVNSSKMEKNEGKCEVYIGNDRHGRQSDILIQRGNQLDCVTHPSIKKRLLEE